MKRLGRAAWFPALLVPALLATACAPTMPEQPRTYTRDWSYVRGALSPFWWYDLVDVKTARTKNATGAGRSVAVVDTGIEVDDPDVPGAQGVATCGSNPSSIADQNGHGTQLTGIAAGRDPGQVTQGVAPGATRVVIKIDCGVVTADSLTRGIDAAIQRNPDVVLLALGGYPAGAPDVNAFLESRIRARPAILFVIASVWDGTRYPFPAWTRLPNAVVVAAMTPTDDKKAEVPYNTKLGDLWAPGREVQTASVGYAAAYSMQGTSAASAIVAGCAALLKQKQPAASGAELKTRLVATAEPKPQLPAPNNRRLNCGQAVP